VDDTVGLQALIENNLVKGCVNITNISSSVNGASNGFPSYAYFERASSNFPFEKGIMLSTGGATSEEILLQHLFLVKAQQLGEQIWI